MDYGILSCIPITVLIIGAVITKRMPEMIILSSIIGAAMVFKTDFLAGFVGQIYGALTNSSYQFLLILLLGFGGIIKLFEKSGALQGFGKALEKIAKGPKQSLVVAWIMSIIMFVDDYLNVLATASSMRGITDKNGIPREHLAYAVNSMGACVCVLIPFSSWAVFAIGIMSEQGLGFTDYVKAIPYMFFPLLAVVVCLLVGIGVIPKVGLIKKGYERVANGGPVLLHEESAGASIVGGGTEAEGDEPAPTTALNFFIPIIVLIVVMILCNNDVVSGIIAAVACQLVMYVAQRIMTLGEFINNFFEGLAGMAPLAFIIMFAYMLNQSNDAMGFTPYLLGVLTKTIPPVLLPMLAFVIVAAVAFATASFWILIVLTIPIFVPLAVTMGIDPVIIVAAIMSGVAFGSKFCFYSDAVFMTSAGTGVAPMTQIKAVAPYVLGSAVLAAIAFLIVGVIAV